MNVQQTFNSKKLKYSKLDDFYNNKFKNEKTNINIFFNCDKMIEEYLECEDRDIGNGIKIQFLKEFLNLIAHYRTYFFKHDILTRIYVSINNSNEITEFVTKIASMIPRIYILNYKKGEDLFFLKYNIIAKIKSMNKNEWFLDIGNSKNNILNFRISTDYAIIDRDNNYNLIIEGYDYFKKEILNNIDEIYIKPILSLWEIFVILENVIDNDKIINSLKKYVEENLWYDFNDVGIKLKALRFITRSKKLAKKVVELNDNLNSIYYNKLSDIIIENWRHNVSDKNILRINEILGIRSNRIAIENLINY